MKNFYKHLIKIYEQIYMSVQENAYALNYLLVIKIYLSAKLHKFAQLTVVFACK